MILTKENNDGDINQYNKIFNRAVLPAAIVTGLAATAAAGKMLGVDDPFTSVHLISQLVGVKQALTRAFSNTDSLWGLYAAGSALIGIYSGVTIAELGEKFALKAAGFTKTTVDTEIASEDQLKEFFDTSCMEEVKEKVQDHIDAQNDTNSFMLGFIGGAIGSASVMNLR